MQRTNTFFCPNQQTLIENQPCSIIDLFLRLKNLQLRAYVDNPRITIHQYDDLYVVVNFRLFWHQTSYVEDAQF